MSIRGDDSRCLRHLRGLCTAILVLVLVLVVLLLVVVLLGLGLVVEGEGFALGGAEVFFGACGVARLGLLLVVSFGLGVSSPRSLAHRWRSCTMARRCHQGARALDGSLWRQQHVRPGGRRLHPGIGWTHGMACGGARSVRGD